MGEFITIVGLVLLTAVIFVIWLAVTLGRLIVSAIFGGRGPKPQVVHDLNGAAACRSSNCRAMNPTYARYCKRCGKATGAAAPVPMRYVA